MAGLFWLIVFLITVRRKLIWKSESRFSTRCFQSCQTCFHVKLHILYQNTFIKLQNLGVKKFFLLKTHSFPIIDLFPNHPSHILSQRFIKIGKSCNITSFSFLLIFFFASRRPKYIAKKSVSKQNLEHPWFEIYYDISRILQ